MATRHDDDPDEESEVLSKRRDVHYHYNQSKNGNGNGNNTLNTVVWAIAALAVGCLITITGIMWNKQIELASSLARLEAQMVIVLQRLPP